MTPQEFKEKFKVGDEIEFKESPHNKFVITGFGENSFLMKYADCNDDTEYSQKMDHGIILSKNQPEYVLMSPICNANLDNGFISDYLFYNKEDAKKYCEFASWPAQQVVTIPKGTIFSCFEHNIKRDFTLCEDLQFLTDVQYRVEKKL